MYEQIRYEVENSIATLTLNRPDRLNAWTEQMGREVKQAFAAAERDPEVVVIVLTGAGRGFCAGADMSALNAISRNEATVEGKDGAGDAYPGDPTLSAFRGPYSYPMSVLKPVIGAINGICVGMALPIALSCDIRFASDKASFSTMFAKRGLVAEWGSSWMLPRIVGLTRAADLLLSARTVGAEEAQQLGLVNRVVPHDDLMKVVREYAADIATNCAPESLAVIKRDMLRHLTSTFDEAEQDSFRHMTESFTRPDFREGVMSFLEKRPPKFTRRGGA